MSSLNKVQLIGRLGNDPDIRSMQSGDRVANLSVATSETWKDKSSGEKKERTQWHKVVVMNQPLVNLIEGYVSKGSQVYLEGQLETRKWQDKNGLDQYTTEVILRPFNGQIVLLGGKSQEQSGHDKAKSNDYQPQDQFEDDIPF